MNTLRLSPWLGLLLAALAHPPVSAAPPAPASAPTPVGTPLVLEGRTLDGQPFSMGQLRGQLLLVVMWHTDCRVCLDKMPELRANVAGWAGRPFSLVSVQLDADEPPARRYWDSVRQLQPSARKTVVLWRGDARYRDNLPAPVHPLPWSLLVGPDGKVVASYHGRIPAEAWDQVAELLP